MKKIEKIKNILKIQDVSIIGSYDDEKLIYKGDVDLQDIVNINIPIDNILPIFKEIYKNIEKIKETYVTDFKVGAYSGQPIRWTYEDLKNGYKQFDNDLKIYFRDALSNKSIIKLDTVSLIDGTYIEVTNNYYFMTDDLKTYKELTDAEVENKMLYDYKIKKKNDELYKALKRLYIFYEHKGNKKKVDELLKIFNSDIGKFNKRLTELETIQLLMKNKKRPTKNKLVNAIHNINDSMGKYKISRLSKIDNKTIKQIDNILDEVIKQNKNILNRNLEELISKSNFNNILK